MIITSKRHPCLHSWASPLLAALLVSSCSGRDSAPPPLTAETLFLATHLTATRPATANEGNWPSFRGPGASGLGTGDPPMEWDLKTGTNVVWKTALPGLGHSSPVIWGERIFVTAAVPEEGEASLKVGLYGDITPLGDASSQSWKVYALDKGSGKILWQRTAHRGRPEIKRHPKSSHANSSPATDGEHLVVFFGSEGLFVYDLDGELKWQRDLGVLDSGFFRVPGAQWGFGSSPILHQGRVIVQVDVQKDSFLAAFDVTDGRELWRTPRADVPTWGTPTVVPYKGDEAIAAQIVVNGWKHIGGYDLETGRELWRLTGGGDIPVPTPILGGNLVLITNAHGGSAPIYAVRTDARGDITGSERYLAWSHDRLGNYLQTPLVHDGIAYFCKGQGVLSALDLETGQTHYRERLGGGASGFTGSPVAAGGRLYVTSEDGDTYVVRLGREFELLATNELGETFMSSPAVSDGTLFFRARHHLIAVAELTRN